MNENKAQNQMANQTNQANQANQQANQTNQANQSNQTNQAKQAAAKYAEAKTIVNGQEVKVKEAQAAEEAFMRQNTQTGIQQHHDNSSEAVEAGQVAQNTAGLNLTELEAKAAVKQFDVQSGQQHLSQHLQQAQQELQKLEQEMQRQEQQRMQQAQQQGQAMQQAQQSQTISQDQKSKIEDHQTIQNALDAKAKAKTKKAD